MGMMDFASAWSCLLSLVFCDTTLWPQMDRFCSLHSSSTSSLKKHQQIIHLTKFVTGCFKFYSVLQLSISLHTDIDTVLFAPIPLLSSCIEVISFLLWYDLFSFYVACLLQKSGHFLLIFFTYSSNVHCTCIGTREYSNANDQGPARK